MDDWLGVQGPRVKGWLSTTDKVGSQVEEGFLCRIYSKRFSVLAITEDFVRKVVRVEGRGLR